MARLIAAILAFVLLSGFSEQDALDRFSGSWQMQDEMYGTAGALSIDKSARTIRAVRDATFVDGKIDRIDLVGASAVFRVADQAVVVYSGPDANSIIVQFGERGLSFRFVRVP